jgi:hypothetical protein
MYQTIRFRVVGISPLVMNNPASKDRAVEGDDKALFMACLYLDDNRRPCIPVDYVDEMLGLDNLMCDWSRTMVWCAGDPRFLYEGPGSPEELWEDPRFRDMANFWRAGLPVRGYRPIFPTWGIEFEVELVPSYVNADEVIKAVRSAGTSGIGADTPRFGRFGVVESLVTAPPLQEPYRTTWERLSTQRAV